MKPSPRPRRAITGSRVVAAFAAAGCMAAVLAAAGTATASTSARLNAVHAPWPAGVTAAQANGRIAFSQWDLLPGGNLSGHSNVYTINPDGTGRLQLTHVGTKQAAGAPDWSPDGTKIVYESNQTGDYRIWVMNADGSGQTQLTNAPGFMDLEPAWSPDGRHIVFSRCTEQPGGTGCDLEMMTAAGTGVRQLAGGHWSWVRAEYSPDGRYIVAAADRGGFLSTLWVMRSNGTGLHRITSPSLEAFWPDWSPDGRGILFTDNCCQGGSNVWTVRPDGTGLRKLTHFGPMPLQGGFASYSPDGRQIVLQYNGKCPARGICQYFYVMNADGSGLRPVHTSVPNTFLTDWGRGRQLAAHRARRTT
jgi:Tol biopolymer transport system component